MTGSTILCVSDDERLLADLRMVLADRSGAWDLRFVGSAEAVRALTEEHVDVIVTKLGTPGTSGMSLLEHAHASYPGVARLVLTGTADGAVVIDAVGPARQLSKPCTPDTLPAALELVLDLRRLVESERLRELFGGLDTLAKPPHIYTQLVALSQDPDSTADDVVNLVQQDVGLSAEVLRLVNSAFYGQSSTVHSIQWAVVLLGLDTLKALAVAGVVFKPGRPLPLGLDSEELAARSVRASVIAQRIAHREHWDPDTVSDVALSALLSEVGLLVLASAQPEQWGRLHELCERMPASRAQEEAFGVTVGRASAYLLGLWGFPPGALAATAAQPIDVSDLTAVAAASPAALAVSYAHQKAYGEADLSLFCRSGYLDDHRLERWQAA
ncbi:MAG TPA: HDOD domain-containing protein [Kineosporiaceae bacterium]|nr:HDOD domain-containing protein [Kineosporiaceae bacterium]